jgi:hypothetical protein
MVSFGFHKASINCMVDDQKLNLLHFLRRALFGETVWDQLPPLKLPISSGQSLDALESLEVSIYGKYSSFSFKGAELLYSGRFGNVRNLQPSSQANSGGMTTGDKIRVSIELTPPTTPPPAGNAKQNEKTKSNSPAVMILDLQMECKFERSVFSLST